MSGMLGSREESFTCFKNLIKNIDLLPEKMTKVAMVAMPKIEKHKNRCQVVIGSE